MTDVVNAETRSRMMAGIRGRDTKPEIIVRKCLHATGFRFRLQQRIGKTKPDLVLSKWKTCIFVNGCYWHRHEGCRLASTPKTNADFWKKKFKENVERDRRNIAELEAAGWRVGVVWECSVRAGKLTEGRIRSLMAQEGSWVL